MDGVPQRRDLRPIRDVSRDRLPGARRPPRWVAAGALALSVAACSAAPPPLSGPFDARLLAALAILGAAGAAVALVLIRRQARLRRRIEELERGRTAEADFSRRLQSLFSILEELGAPRAPEAVMETAACALARILQVKGVAIKLLSPDGQTLRYAAACGLPADLTRESAVEVAKSPLNQRILQGEPYVTGQVTGSELFQFGEALTAARIRSVLFLPLPIEGRVIGILGAYCERPDRFGGEDIAFYRLTARLTAVVIENARAYAALKAAADERSRFMVKVAHNLRAPLVAMLSILEVVRGGYLGAVNDAQNEYLRRLDRRARTLLDLVSDLMALARNRGPRAAAGGATDPQELARRVRRTFQDKAAEKGLRFNVHVPEGIGRIAGELETVEHVLENLVSNAIKYTPAEGAVDVAFSRADGTVRIEVSDTGIGIPRAEQPRVFTEFFRAENAKSMEALGTGLGLAIAREIVERLGGRIFVESEENAGTIFVVHLPTAPEGPAPPEESCR